MTISEKQIEEEVKRLLRKEKIEEAQNFLDSHRQEVGWAYGRINLLIEEAIETYLGRSNKGIKKEATGEIIDQFASFFLFFSRLWNLNQEK